jgi:pantetheine-phosphate adenylyltransferase
LNRFNTAQYGAEKHPVAPGSGILAHSQYHAKPKSDAATLAHLRVPVGKSLRGDTREARLEYERATASMKTSIAIYPGSFDPVTNGHLDLIERGEKMFDLVIVAVLRNAEKQPLFTVPERVEMLREVTKRWSAVEVDVFDGLLVDYARKRGAGVILRGIRAVSDYEYELQMALMNRKLEPRLETVFMLPGEPYSYLSAKLVREIAQLGGPLDGLVPPVVEERLRAKIS